MKKTRRKTIQSFGELLWPDYFLFCSMCVLSDDTTVSLIKVMDFVEAEELPYTVPNFVLVAGFLRNPSISARQYLEAAPQIKVMLTNPQGETFDAGTSWPEDGQPGSMVNRLIIDMSRRLQLKHSGLYKFDIVGSITGGEPVRLFTRILPVRLMQKLQAQTSMRTLPPAGRIEQRGRE